MQGTFKIIELVSQKSSISEVEPLLKTLQEYVGMKEDTYHNMLIAITEAVNNALIHGNKLDTAKKVIMQINVLPEEIEFIIDDEGGGFDPDLVPDPRHPENLLKDNGRGVFLIRNLAFKSHYESTDNGTKVKIYFKIN